MYHNPYYIVSEHPAHNQYYTTNKPRYIPRTEPTEKQASPVALRNQSVCRAIRDLKTSLAHEDQPGTVNPNRLCPVTVAPQPPHTGALLALADLRAAEKPSVSLAKALSQSSWKPRSDILSGELASNDGFSMIGDRVLLCDKLEDTSLFTLGTAEVVVVVVASVIRRSNSVMKVWQLLCLILYFPPLRLRTKASALMAFQVY
jgi:hypothetical protein